MRLSPRASAVVVATVALAIVVGGVVAGNAQPAPPALAPLTADVALIRAHLADKLGNLVYDKTARNFNPVMATAARTVVAEVDEVVEIGELDPERVATPHLYVDHLVLAKERL